MNQDAKKILQAAALGAAHGRIAESTRLPSRVLRDVCTDLSAYSGSGDYLYNPGKLESECLDLIYAQIEQRGNGVRNIDAQPRFTTVQFMLYAALDLMNEVSK